jgi:hypothetical protein
MISSNQSALDLNDEVPLTVQTYSDAMREMHYHVSRMNQAEQACSILGLNELAEKIGTWADAVDKFVAIASRREGELLKMVEKYNEFKG